MGKIEGSVAREILVQLCRDPQDLDTARDRIPHDTRAGADRMYARGE